MGAAERISFEELRASQQQPILRQALPTRLDEWLDEPDSQLTQPAPTLAQVTETVWTVRQALTGALTETIVAHTHQEEDARQQTPCATCGRVLTARTPVARTVETMVGARHLARPSFYCLACPQGLYPLDEALGVGAGRNQLAMQHAMAKIVPAVPYDTAQSLCGELTGLHCGSERMHTLTTQVGAGLTVWQVAPSRQEIAERIAEVAAGRLRRPGLVRGIDGAYVPTRPESARQPGHGRRSKRARRTPWRGQWRDAQGCRFSLLDGERIVQGLSWPQVHTEAQLGEALQQIKAAGLIPEAQVRLCVVCDGAEWLWRHVQVLFPQARQVLDYSHCAPYLHRVAQARDGVSAQAVEWVEATRTRLYLGKVSRVLGGLKRRQAQADEAKQALANCWNYLDAHRGRTAYRTLRRGGYPLGSGGIESSNKFMCHVRLKRSGAWWYEDNSHQMLALRCAKYNGTFTPVFVGYQQRLRAV